MSWCLKLHQIAKQCYLLIDFRMANQYTVLYSIEHAQYIEELSLTNSGSDETVTKQRQQSMMLLQKCSLTSSQSFNTV